MAELNTPALANLAAWPMSTLHSASQSVVGFLMPKVSGHSPVFKLYGPKLRLQEFPKADWRFLIHAAANAARAFSTVHAAGLVIGDVNHGNLMVGRDGTVRLIDCDSFQITRGRQTWFCEVGVGTHQPPEMQVHSSFANVLRTPNHDNFGLAVIIFQLLCMARHPFAGRSLGPGDPPSIEEAIAHSRYAYSRDQQRTKMIPPPGSLPIDALTSDVQDLFESAFNPRAALGGRPTGVRWVSALQQLGSSLAQCPLNQAHYYKASIPRCPWCQIEAASGYPLFPVIFVARTGHPGGIAALWQEVTKVTEPRPLPPLPDPHAGLPAPSAEALAVSHQGRKLKLFSYVSIAVTAAALIAAAPPNLRVVFGIAIFAASAAILRTGKPVTRTVEKKQLDAAANDWHALELAWADASGAASFAAIRQELDRIRAQYDEIPEQRAKRLQQLAESVRQKQFEDFLDRFPIASAKIPGVGRAKITTLASHGIDTANDIIESKILAIPGFGDATTAKLVTWRRAHERNFQFSTSQGVPQSDLATLELDIAMLRARLEAEITAGLGRLKAVAASANSRRQLLTANAAALTPRYAQAIADAAAVTGYTTNYKRLLAVAGAAIGLAAIMFVTGKGPQAGTSAPAVQPAVAVLLSQSSPPLPVAAASTIQSHTDPSPVVPIIQSVASHLSDPVAVQQKHVVTRQECNLRQGPDNTSAVIRVIPQGKMLTAFSRNAGWVQVGDDVPIGWIYSGLLADVQ